jgi:phosphate transport system substrate-binding protein
LKNYFESRNRIIPYIYIGLSLLITSCLHQGGPKITETPTRGDIRILVDESFAPIIDAEIKTFTSLYYNAKITPLYKPEVDVINDFMNDSARVMVTSRKLTDDQIKYLRDTLIVARTTTFAYDALALVINKSNPDSLLKFEDVRNIFTGKVSAWKEINPRSQVGNIRVIFDNTKSGNIRYFREKFEYNEPLPPNFYAVNSNAEVIDFVENNRDALGIISVNWISDRDDSTMANFSNRIKVVAVSQLYLNDGSYFRPQQGAIYNRSYPFVREIYLISRETFTGLGSGFIQWATAEQGQRIVLKSGLVPATMPIRLVQIKQE